MVPRTDLEQLRSELKRRRQAATRKVNRIEAQGIRIAGSKHDPRREVDVKKYNVKQMQSYLEKLNTFTSRKNQYVANFRNDPIPKSEWRAYQRAQTKANAQSDKLYNQLKNVVIDKNGTTIGMRDAITRSEFPKTANPAVNSPFQKVYRVPKQVTTQRALRQMLKQQQAKIDPKFQENFVRESKKQLRRMLKDGNMMFLMKEVNQLTDKQFHILWGYTGFALDISTVYENEKKAKNDGESRPDEKMKSDSLAGAREMISYAKSIKD